MFFEMVRNVVVALGCFLATPVLMGFAIGFVQGVRTERKPTLRVFHGES